MVFALVFLVQIFNSLKKIIAWDPLLLFNTQYWYVQRADASSRWFFWESLTMVEVEHLPAVGTAFRSKQPAVVPADAKSMHVTSASAMAIHLLLSDCSLSFQLCKWSETTQTRLSKLSPSDAKPEIGHTVFIPLSNLPHSLFALQNQLKSQAAVCSAPPSQPATLAVSVFAPHENSGCRHWPRVVLSRENGLSFISRLLHGLQLFMFYKFRTSIPFFFFLASISLFSKRFFMCLVAFCSPPKS